MVWGTVVITPKHNTIGCIRANQCHAHFLAKRKDIVFVLQQDDAFKGSTKVQTLVFWTTYHTVWNGVPRGGIIHLAQFKTSLQQSANTDIDIFFTDFTIGNGLFQTLSIDTSTFYVGSAKKSSCTG